MKLQSKQKYQFPDLEMEELMNELDMLGFEVGSNFWESINNEIAADLYLNCLSIALEIDVEDIRPEELMGQLPSMAAGIISENGKSQIRPIGNLRFLRYCRILWMMIGIEDFSMNDVHRPTPDRIYSFLCGFVNLMRFKEDRWMTYKNEFYEIEEILDSVDKSNDQIKQKKEDLNNIRVRYNEQSGEIANRRRDNQEFQEKMRSLHGEFLQNQQELKRLTQLDNDLKEQLKDVEFRISTGNQDIQDLKDQVVQSPERLRNTVEELNRSLENERKQIEQISIRNNELKERQSLLQKVEKRLGKARGFLDQVNNGIKDANNAKQSIKEIEHHIEKDKWTIEQTTEEEKLLLQTVEQISLRIQNNQLHYESLIEEAQSLLEQEKQKFEQGQAFLDTQSSEAFSLERQAEFMERDIQNSKINHEKTMNALMNLHNQLLNVLKNYSKQVITQLNQIGSKYNLRLPEDEAKENSADLNH
ncbi:Nuf2 family protein [Cryptosporidium felis]|nr:Nuf2 family protein [Cryptosporidium felis]